jgi:Tol biopolymer transport system component
MPRTLSLIAALLTAALLAAAAPAGALVPGLATIVDRPDGFGPLPFDGATGATLGRHALSADGRYVAFSSSNDVLADGDDDTSAHVYRLDRATGALAQVDTASDGAQPAPFSTSDKASISADGRYVAFHTVSQAAPFTPGVRIGIYVKDLQTGALTLASRGTGPAGAPAAGPSEAMISGDGRHVVFVDDGALDAANVDGVANGSDAYVRDLDAQTTRMVSVKADGTRGGGIEPLRPFGIDFAGDAVTLVTTTALVPGDAGSDFDAYLRTVGANERTVLISATGPLTTAQDADLSAGGTAAAVQDFSGSIWLVPLGGGTPGTPRELSVPRSGGTGGHASAPAFEPAASAAAPQRVAFLTSSALDASDVNRRPDLYTADPAHPGDGGFVELATSGHAAGDVIAGAAAGTTVVFQAQAPDLPGGDGAVPQVYLRSGTGDVALSLRDAPRPNATTGASLLSAAGPVDRDGQVVAFLAAGPAFGSGPLTEVPGRYGLQALVRHLDSGRTENASAATDGADSRADASSLSVDAAGDRVAFTSNATDLGVTPNATHARHAYVRDLRTGALTLVDRTTAGAPLPTGVNAVALSADGTHAAYASGSSGRPGIPDTAIGAHVVVVDLRDGSAQVGDRGPDRALANQEVAAFALDADGGRIAFSSPATNLGAGDPGGRRQAYLRDLATGTTRWVSRPQDGAVAHAAVSNVAVDGAGRRVAFDQSAPDFGFGMTGTAQVFVADLVDGTTTLAGLDTGGRPLDRTDTPALSADGTKLAFTSGAGSGPGLRQVWWHDLATGTSVLASATPDGRPTAGTADSAEISGDGRCVVFRAQATDLVPGGYGPDLAHAYRSCPAAPPPGGGDGGAGPGSGGGAPGGPGTLPAPARDRTAPVLTRARLTRTRFAVGTGRARRGHPARGTAFAFTLSEDATVRIAITHGVAGRRSGRRCVAPRRGLTRRCTRTVTVLRLSRRLERGAGRMTFSGRAGRTRLRPGAYRAELVARDAAGNASRTVRLAFTVVKP